ncbi:MAG: phage tail tape measure protein [Thioalkalivibrionaceae bacterium]
MSAAQLTLGVLLTATDRLTGPLKDVSESIEGINQRAARLAEIGTHLTGMGMAAGHVSRQLRGLLDGPVQAAAQFEAAMAGVRAVTDGITDDAFESLRKKALELGSTTSFSAREAAEGMEFLAKAGFDANQQIEAMPSMLALARAGKVELGAAADIASNVLSGFRMEASEMTRVADAMVMAATTSNVDIHMIGESMKYVSGTAEQAGLSIEETLAMIGLMGNAGIQASQSGTALRAMLQRLASPSDAAAGILAELGVETVDAAGNLRNLTDILNDMAAGMEGMGSGQKLASISEVFGLIASTASGTLLNEGDDILAYIERINDAEGRAAAVAEAMGDNLLGANTRLQSAIEGLNIALGTLLLPTLAELTDRVTALVGRITEWVDAHPRLARGIMMTIAALAGITAVLGPVFLMVGGLFLMAAWIARMVVVLKVWRAAQLAAAAATAVHGGAMSGLAVVLWGRLLGALRAARVAALALSRTLLLSPIGWIGMAIAGVALLVYKYWDPISDFFAGIWIGLQDAFAPVLEALTQAWEPVALAMQPLLAMLTQLWEWFGRLLTPIEAVGDGAESMGRAFGQVLAEIILFPTRMLIAFVRLPAALGSVGMAIVRSLIDALQSWSPLEWIREQWDAVMDYLKEVPGRMFEAGKEIAIGLRDGIISAPGRVADAVTGTVGGAVNRAKDVLGIRSPSRVFMEIGGQLTAGLSAGVSHGSRVVRETVGNLGHGLGRPLVAGIGAVAAAGASAAPLEHGPGALTPSAPIAITINVTVNGNADGDDIAERVRREVEAILRERDDAAGLARRGRLFD